MAGELVGLKVDVLVTHGGAGTFAAKVATKTIPIVFAANGDVVASGVVASLAHPGGNITGSTFFRREMILKRLQLLKEILPHINKVAFLIHDDRVSISQAFDGMEAGATSLKLQIQRFVVRGPDEFDGAFAAIDKQKFDALAIAEQPMIVVNASHIARRATKLQLPSVGFTEFAEADGMIGYGANPLDLYRRVGYFVDKILKGTQPADIPIEQATKFELIINMKTAKALGIKIPQSILVQATKVIE